MLEPRAPRPALRLRALSELTAAGIRCNLLMMPMIPGLTDEPGAIESVIKAGRRAGAAAIWWRSLFLKPAAARRFIPFIQANYPNTGERINLFYEQATYAPTAYDEHLRGIFDRLWRKYGYDAASVRSEVMDTPPATKARMAPAQQLLLIARK
jgi:DNA repair photolyase